MRYNASLGVATLALFVLPASDALVEVVDKPDASLTNSFYAGNRSPLLPSNQAIRNMKRLSTTSAKV
jgi:hypothetical protein